LLDPSKDDKATRNQSLDSRQFLKKHVRTQYDESLLDDVIRLQVYAWVCKQLRNHVHDGILQVVPQPGRQYGNATNVALMIDGIPELAPGADNGMEQSHYDDLGVWLAEPVSVFSSPAMVADLATAGFTLMGGRAGVRRDVHEADCPQQASCRDRHRTGCRREGLRRCRQRRS
jgi:hypothetical protein